MVLAIGVYVPPVPSSGLPVWQEVPLAILGAAIAFGLMYGVLALSRLPAERRIRRRVQAVQAAGAESPVYGPAVVYAAAARLFGEVMAAWDAGDRDRLRGLSDPDLMSDWTRRMDGYAAADGRYRVKVLKGPRLGYVGLLGDHGQVRVRVRAKLRRALELSDGKRRALPEDRGRQKVAFEEYWTLSRSEGEWILWSTRDARFRTKCSTEPIVPPAATRAATPAASKLPEPPLDRG